MKIGISLPVRELQNDIEAIKTFAREAEALGFTHLRVPEQVIRTNSGPLHEPLTIMALVAGVTQSIELVPFVILPARQTVLVAKQVATLDVISNGRVRLGVGVGKNSEEYKSLKSDFNNRGIRCEEQIELLKELWMNEEVNFEGNWDRVQGLNLNPLPIQRPIPIWIAASSVPIPRIRQRIGRQADGWFVLCTPEEFPEIKSDVLREAEMTGRDPNEIGTEAGVAVVGPRQAEWKHRVAGWRDAGLTYLCLRTLGAGLNRDQHLEAMSAAARELPSI
tara:strand:+ start:155 stop:985 length:831 start_codon:yes stop_codon:yes gene_type:complete